MHFSYEAVPLQVKRDRRRVLLRMQYQNNRNSTHAPIIRVCFKVLRGHVGHGDNVGDVTGGAGTIIVEAEETRVTLHDINDARQRRERLSNKAANAGR